MIVTVALMRHGGSHLIRPIVSRLGASRIIEPGNFGHPVDRAKGPVIVFLRDPRDRMVSTYRWWLTKPRKAEQLEDAGSTPDEQIAWLLSVGGDKVNRIGNPLPGKRFVEEMLTWAMIWCPYRGSLIVRFEDLRTSGAREIDRIADHLHVKCDTQAVFDEVYGRGRTYTGRHSDWREYFGPAATAAWNRHHGPRLLEIMGYA